MLKFILPLAAATMLVGCESSMSIQPTASSSRQETAQLAAYAANANYPQNARASYNQDWRVGATVQKNDIRLMNYSDHAIDNVNVWVNGTWVRHLDNLPPKGSVTLSTSDFYNQNGRVLSESNFPLETARIEIQNGNNLYSVMGPVAGSE